MKEVQVKKKQREVIKPSQENSFQLFKHKKTVGSSTLLYNEQKQMKINIGNERQKKIQGLNRQKLSIALSRYKNQKTQRKRVSENLADCHKNFKGKQYKNLNRDKNTEEGGSIHPNVEDSESTKQFTKYQNRLTTENLMLDLNRIRNQIKNERKSQNVLLSETCRSVANSVTHKNLTSTKSVSNFSHHANSKLATLKKQLKIQQKDRKDEEIGDLLSQIQQIQHLNQKIKEENIQYRLVKLSFSSESMQLLSIKLEIQDLKKKINLIRNERKQQKEEINFSEYYTGKKLRLQSVNQGKGSKMCFRGSPQQGEKYKGCQITQRMISTGKCISNIRIQSPCFISPYVTGSQKIIDKKLIGNPMKEKQSEKGKKVKNLGRERMNKMCQKQTQTGQKDGDEYNSYYKKE